MLSSVSVAWSDILSSIRRSHWLTGAAENGAMCNKLKMIALLEKRLELDRRNHGKNGHHFDISAMFFSCTLSDSRTTLTANLALASTVELSLLSVEEQENRGHGWYKQWQPPACTASILFSCRDDKRRTHASYMRWYLHPQISVEEQTEKEPIAWVLYDSNLHALQVLFGVGEETIEGGHGAYMQWPARTFTVDVCFHWRTVHSDPFLFL